MQLSSICRRSFIISGGSERCGQVVSVEWGGQMCMSVSVVARLFGCSVARLPGCSVARPPPAALGRLVGTACGSGLGCRMPLVTVVPSKIATSPISACSPDPARVSRYGLCLVVGGNIRDG